MLNKVDGETENIANNIHLANGQQSQELIRYVEIQTWKLRTPKTWDVSPTTMLI